jgi:hypothetical protein
MLRLNMGRCVSFAGIPVALFFAGCALESNEASSDESIESAEAPLVSPDDPYYQYSLAGNPPSLGVHGKYMQRAPSGAPSSVGEYSNYQDLDVISTSQTSWLASCRKNYVTANRFDDRLKDAAGAAQTAMSGVLQAPDDVLWPWKQIGATTSSTPKQSRFYGYEPMHARWLKSQYAPGSSSWVPEVNYQYDEPREMEDIRERGARLYCSAREAIARQGSKKTMGRLSAFHVYIAGHRIEFLSVEPSVRIAGAERFTNEGTNDGAQAFSIPMHMGTLVTPIRGLGLPSLSEAIFPVSFVTGDSEIAGRTNYESVGTGMRYIPGMGFIKTSKMKYSKEYHSASHADGVLSEHMGLKAHKKIPMFYVGPVEVWLDFNFNMTVGEVSANTSETSSVLAYVPTPRREWWGSHSGVTYNDGPWDKIYGPGIVPIQSGFKVLPQGTNEWFWRGSNAQLGPMAIRAHQNDDHDLDAKTNMRLDATLGGTLGPSFGPAQIYATVKGTVSGDVAQHHMIRDAVRAEGRGGSRMVGVTGLSVHPRTTAEVTMAPLDASLRIVLDYWFGTIDWDVKLLHVDPITLASYDSDDSDSWPEKTRLRVGTGSEAGDSMMKPSVNSHVFGSGNYASFPKSVDACLAEPSIEPVDPEVCTPEPPDQGSAPHVNMCAFMTVRNDGNNLVQFPPKNVCGAKSSWAKNMAPLPGLISCTTDLLDYLCSPISYEQQASQSSVNVSHVANTHAELTEVFEILESCANRAGQLGMSEASITSWFEDDFGISACDANGRLIDNEELVSGPTDPNQAPSADAGRTCP